jgi:hypothetical protein
MSKITDCDLEAGRLAASSRIRIRFRLTQAPYSLTKKGTAVLSNFPG